VGTYVQIHAPLPEKSIYFNKFFVPSDTASILNIPRIDTTSIFKNARIDAGSEPEIVIKLFENCFYFKLLLKIKKITDALQL